MDSLLRLVGDMNDIGHAILYSNRRIPSTEFNHASRVNVTESETDKVIADVVRHYTSMKVNPCFEVSPATQPQTFASSLLRRNFKLALEEDVMVYRGKGKRFKVSPDVKVVATDGSLVDVWIDVFMKGFAVPVVLRDAFLDMLGKASQHEGTKSYLGYFQGKPAGVCALLSFNNVGGIFNVGTTPEHRRKGIATALLHKTIGDSLSSGNNPLYLFTRKGSDAERLYSNLGFQVAYTRRLYELQLQKNSKRKSEKRSITFSKPV